MAYYPGHPDDVATAGRFPQLVESTEAIINDVTVEYASNGAVRMQRKNPLPLREYNLVHTVTTADRITLENFYIANRNEVFPMYYRPASRYVSKCVFSGVPQFVPLQVGYWRVTCPVTEI